MHFLVLIRGGEPSAREMRDPSTTPGINCCGSYPPDYPPQARTTLHAQRQVPGSNKNEHKKVVLEQESCMSEAGYSRKLQIRGSQGGGGSGKEDQFLAGATCSCCLSSEATPLKLS